MKQLIFFMIAVLLAVTANATENGKSDCYPITSADLITEDAPKFSRFPAKVEKIIHPARVDTKSQPRAIKFRTVLREGAAEGPNFAGHYTVVTWGCGTGCVQFAIVNAKTGKVVFPETFTYLSFDGFMVDASEGNPKGDCLEYKLDSRLIIVYGSLDEDENRQGVFYFVMENDKLKLVSSVKVKKHPCDPEDDGR